MDNILPFNIRRDVSASAESDTTFDLANMSDGAVDFSSGRPALLNTGIQGTQFPEMSPTQDWSNQDLASFMRAKRLLSMAGMPLDTDRGISDEGDPWFVFLDRHDEVFAHFARINGIYILDSTAQHEIIEAFSLEDLVAAFARTTTPVQGDKNAPAQVISLAGIQRAKVRVHPGAALAALVWSIYITSDELALPLMGNLVDDLFPLETGNAHISTFAHFPETETSSIALAALSQDLTDERGAPEKDAAPGSQHHATQAAPLQTVAQSIGFGLTTIAISNGLYFWLTGEQLLHDARDAAQTLGVIIASLPDEAKELHADLVELQSFVTTAQAILQDDIAHSEQPEQPTSVEQQAQAAEEGDQPLIEAADLAPSPAQADGENVHPNSGAAASLPEGRSLDTLAISTQEVVEPSVEDINVQSDLIAKEHVLEVLSNFRELTADVFTDVITQLSNTSFDIQLSGFTALSSETLTTETVTVSIDAPSTPPVITTDVSPSSIEPTAPRFSLFNDDAHDFIVFLLGKGDDTRRSDYNNEVVLVDLDAFDGQGDVVYARSWSFEDGSVISAVGLKSDFEAFDLIV